MKWLRRILIGVALGVPACIGLLLLTLWIERNRPTELPRPTGPFAVGRAIQGWTDDAHSDPLAPAPGTKRELLVWIWYPSAPGQSGAMDDCLPAQLRPRAEASGGANIWTLLTRDSSKVHGRAVLKSSEVCG